MVSQNCSIANSFLILIEIIIATAFEKIEARHNMMYWDYSVDIIPPPKVRF